MYFCLFVCRKGVFPLKLIIYRYFNKNNNLQIYIFTSNIASWFYKKPIYYFLRLTQLFLYKLWYYFSPLIANDMQKCTYPFHSSNSECMFQIGNILILTVFLHHRFLFCFAVVNLML